MRSTVKQSGSRRVAREYALRELYGINLQLNREMEPLPPIANWWNSEDNLSVNREADEFARELIFGVREEQNDLDELIKKHALKWRLDRMSLVDRNILRIAVWELRHHPDVPTSVILNEALELAKCYGDVDSPRFVNGILDPLAKKLRENETV